LRDAKLGGAQNAEEREVGEVGESPSIEREVLGGGNLYIAVRAQRQNYNRSWQCCTHYFGKSYRQRFQKKTRKLLP